jgi:hypothetical protein
MEPLCIEIFVLKARPFQAKAAVEELAPAYAGLLMDEVGVGRWKAREIGGFILQP